MAVKLSKRALEALKPDAGSKPREVRDTDLTGLLVRVEASGRKTFFLDYRHAGRRNRYRLGTYPAVSVDGARELARIKAGEVARGIDIQADKKAQRVTAARMRLATLGTFLHRYETWETAHRKVRHAARIRGVFPGAWLTQPLAALDAWKLESWRRDARGHGKHPSTINRDIAALK